MEEAQNYIVAIALGAEEHSVYEGRPDGPPAAVCIQAGYFVARADALYLTFTFSDAVADCDRAKGFREPEGYNLIWSTPPRSSVGSPNETGNLRSALDAGAVTGRPKVVESWSLAEARRQRPRQRERMAIKRSCRHGRQRPRIGREGAFNRTRCMPEIIRECRDAVALLKSLER
jgi:hypothetical protein